MAGSSPAMTKREGDSIRSGTALIAYAVALRRGRRRDRRRGPGCEVAGRLRLALVVQGPMHRRERGLVPRDVVPMEEGDFEALRSRRDRLVEEARPVDQLYLADARDVVDRQE